MNDYQRIARALEYISSNIESQPSLDDIAQHINLSRHHCQRLFSRWAGISPKRFLQFITVYQAKQLLNSDLSILDTSEQLGLSSSARLHDQFISIEAVTPGEYKTGGLELNINYEIHPTPIGDVFIAMTERGICKLTFIDGNNIKKCLADLKQTWPRAHVFETKNKMGSLVSNIFDMKTKKPISLFVKGTNFQVNVWKALLNIQPGHISTYGHLAKHIGDIKASRAVGHAIGVNPIAFLIPCHRVILASGAIGNYRWGNTRKQALLCWEQARLKRLTEK